MKQHLILFLALTLSLFIGCAEKEKTNELDAERKSVSKTEAATINVPENTKINYITDDYSELVLAEDAFFVAQDAEQFVLLRQMGVRCKCTSGTGCNPTLAGGQYGCVMVDCKICEKSTTSVSGSRVDYQGSLDFNKGITLLVDKEIEDPIEALLTSTDASLLGNAFPAMFEVRRVTDGLLEFLNFVYEDNIPAFIYNGPTVLPEGIEYFGLNIYGNETLVPLPVELLEGYQTHRYGSSIEALSCVCHAGSSGCVKKSAGMGSVKYCDAGGCTDCELKD